MKYLSLFGSTGSIGKNTLEIVRRFPDQFKIKALVANSSIDLLYEQAQEFHPELICVYDDKSAEELRKKLSTPILSGDEGLLEVASMDVTHVVLAMSGSKALHAALKAISLKREILLANKEILVMAGELIMKRAKEFGAPIIPIDSEHSALFQCLRGERSSEVQRLILTASGGPFFKYSSEELKKVDLKAALNHPRWKMGQKVTIDSSTLMNKGLEIIEAYHLFQLPLSKIDVVIHPQSIIHSMVEFIDGSVIMQSSEPHMIYPIQFALSYPDRLPTNFAPFDFTKNSHLEFFTPDYEKFPCLRLAKEALKEGKSYPCFLNGCNEVLVARFLKKEISWHEIGEKLKKLISSHRPRNVLDLGEVMQTDKEARILSTKI